MSQGSRFINLLALVALSAGLLGCGSSQTSPPLAQARSSPTTTALASSRDSADVSGDATDYRITPQDILQVAVFQVPDLTRTVQVDGSGFVTLPLVGNVPVRGKTLLQAQNDITVRYQKSYLQSPQVTVSLVKSGQRVTVSGAVKGPAVLTLDVPLTLSMAIAQAGGMGETGNPERVHIARTSAGEAVEDSVFNLNDIQAGKAPNPMLRGGDIVVVEDSQRNWPSRTSRMSCRWQPLLPSLLCPMRAQSETLLRSPSGKTDCNCIDIIMRGAIRCMLGSWHKRCARSLRARFCAARMDISEWIMLA